MSVFTGQNIGGGNIYLLIHYFGSTGLWVAIPISWGMACIITIIRYFSGKWKTKAVMKNN
ncbi:MAG: hypothetical protein ACERKZ_11505 [Lachnotalea sp.]